MCIRDRDVLQLIKRNTSGLPDAGQLEILESVRDHLNGRDNSGHVLLQSDEISVADVMEMIDRRIARHQRNTAATYKAIAGAMAAHAQASVRRSHFHRSHSFAAMAGGAA